MARSDYLFEKAIFDLFQIDCGTFYTRKLYCIGKLEGEKISKM
ncbi:hypothetical protein HE1_00448 [Holospora elegans E1]|uniref:Uncharacterized protein n=1 Tax=Holospora elegans E1 TaxID=1427503 RepID=A0A023DYP3_9PROT|nr:hypothetical protein HE1_00448 [Holospora elegans E1]